MARSRQEVLLRRQILLDRIAAQRAQMAGMTAHWQPALVQADRALVLVKFVRAHSVALMGLTGLFIVRRKGFTVLAKGAWRAWRLYRYVNDFSKKIIS